MVPTILNARCVIKKIFRHQFYGFIQTADGRVEKDIFFHAMKMNNPRLFSALHLGDIVHADIYEVDGRYVAVGVDARPYGEV